MELEGTTFCLDDTYLGLPFLVALFPLISLIFVGKCSKCFSSGFHRFVWYRDSPFNSGIPFLLATLPVLSGGRYWKCTSCTTEEAVLKTPNRFSEKNWKYQDIDLKPCQVYYVTNFTLESGRILLGSFPSNCGDLFKYLGGFIYLLKCIHVKLRSVKFFLKH